MGATESDMPSEVELRPDIEKCVTQGTQVVENLYGLWKFISEFHRKDHFLKNKICFVL